MLCIKAARIWEQGKNGLENQNVAERGAERELSADGAVDERELSAGGRKAVESGSKTAMNIGLNIGSIAVRMTPMKIRDLLSVLPKEASHLMSTSATQLGPDQGLAVALELTTDSRKVQPGSVFVALKGTKFDSHQELANVCAAGAAGVIVEDKKNIPSDYKGAVVEVKNSRQALAHLAARFYGDPSLHFFSVGVTGTNGKTSCTYIIEHILNSVHLPTGVIGTIQHRLRDQVWPTESTTPGPIELQARLSEMRASGARALAMEVSSHALDQYRADAIHFNAVIFTNLTLDHLDYHGAMEKYFAAKQRLFTDLLWETKKSPLIAAVNIDDEWGRRLKVAFPAETLTFGEKEGADFKFRSLKMDFSGTQFELKSLFGEFTAEIPLCGRHNLYNVVGCVAACLALGISPAISLKALETFPGVPGRLQRVPNTKGISIFVDYAHTPDALENVLSTLVKVREESSSQGKIWLVFGCGGDRDKGKRPQMAKIAERLADQIIVTSDNPRTENPLTILQEIVAGFSGGSATGMAGAKAYKMIEDRGLAIRTALQSARAGDVVLIAGKGHEDYQIIGTEKKHFSDFETAQEACK